MQELGKSNEWVSETIFTVLFVSFLLWTFSPFVMARKRFYTVVLYARLLMVLVCESLLHKRGPRQAAARAEGVETDGKTQSRSIEEGPEWKSWQSGTD